MKRTETAPSVRSYAWQFAAAGSVMTVLFFFCINYSTGLSYPWFVYPSLAVLWWPLSVYFAVHHQYRQFSIFGAALTVCTLCLINLVFSPQHLWFPYAVYPVIFWPIAAYTGKRMGDIRLALIGFIVTSFYYIGLNFLLSPAFPWALFPVYAVAWWPLSIRFAARKEQFRYSVAGTALSAVFFCAVNFITTPNNIWAIYPIFALLWWPLAIYFFKIRKSAQ